MTVLVIGANGGIGKRFCRLAAETDVPVRAMVRDPSQEGYFRELGLDTVSADLEEADLSRVFEGCRQVIFTAGSGPHTGPDKTLLVDLYGAIRAADYAVEQGLERFLMVSALRADAPLQAPEKLRPYMAAKFAADHYLMHAGVPWLILKPGRLTDEAGTGCIALDPEPGGSITVSRDNVAAVLLAVIRRPQLHEQELRFVDGAGEIEEALPLG